MAKKPTAAKQGAKVHDPREAPKLVKMVRGPQFPEPHTADVHPNEVENWREAGFTEE